MKTVEQLLHPYSPPETTLVDRLRYWKSANPDRIAYRFLSDGVQVTESITFSQLDERVRACAAKLTAMGLRGKRALLMYPSGLDFIIALYGCHYAGITAVPAFPPRRNRNMGRINTIADDAKTVVALTTRDVIKRREAMTNDCASLLEQEWLATEEIPLELAGDWVKPGVLPDDIAVLQYTSGSTGTPKGVVLTHANILANCRYISTGFQIDCNQDSGAGWLPFYHDMGLVGGIINPMYCCVTSSLMSPVHFLSKPIRWLQLLSNFKVTISGGPNFAYALCNEKIEESACQDLDLSHWKIAFNGAEPIRADVLRKFTEKFSPFGFKNTTHYPCYGMAETTLLVTGGEPDAEPVIRCFDAEDLSHHRVVSVEPDSPKCKELVGCGQAQLDEEVIIVHPEHRKRLPEGQIGEIWVRSLSVGLGYLDNEQDTKTTFQAELFDEPGKHFLRTGDLGFLVEHELFCAGRLKDMIIIRGVNRYPQDIEATVERSSSRFRAGGAAAFAIDHWDRERLVIVCEVERGPNNQWKDELETIRSNVIDEHELPPDEIILVRAGSIPKTSSGKVQRQATRLAYRDNKLLIVEQWASEMPTGRPTPDKVSRPLSTRNKELLGVVEHHVRLVAKERAGEIDSNTNIVVDLGLDSLERLQIANALEEHFGGRFPDDVLQEIETVGEVASAIEQYIGVHRNGTLTTPVQPVTPKKRRIEGEIPETFYKLEKMPEYIRFERLKSMMDSSGIRNPFFSVHEGRIADTTRIDGQELISFSSYNYVGMSGEPSVNQSAIDAINTFGTSVSASRLVSGEKTIHRTLEAELGQFLGVEDIITFPGGHATNETVIGHMVGPGDLIIHDSYAHNSIIQGAELSGARRRPFAHNSWQVLDDILTEIRHDYHRVLIAIEGLYSMDGDYPELDKFVEVKDRHRAMLFVDEAHSIGTMGKTGRGLGEMFQIPRERVEMWMGTLSKSLGSCGGFIGGSKTLVDYLRYTTPGFVFAAGLPPANVGAALGSLRLLRQEPQRVTKLQNNSKLFLDLAKRAGLDTGLSNNSPIIPVITGSSLLALRLSEALYHNQINAQPILHPAVDEDQTRLRFFITSCHSEEQIRYTIDIISQEWEKITKKKMVTS